MSINIRQKLTAIQQKLKAPKGQTNKFGGYKYRSAEDILLAVKPLCGEFDCTLVIEDQLIQSGDRYYIQATVILGDNNSEHAITTTALAREAETKKGMDEAQITGSASSYARKYALNGLFAIDDTKDPDATNTHGKAPTKTAPKREPKNDDYL